MFRLACFIIVFAASTHAGAKSAETLKQVPSKQEQKVAEKASLPCQVAMQSGDLSPKNYSARINRTLDGVGKEEPKEKVPAKTSKITK